MATSVTAPQSKKKPNMILIVVILAVVLAGAGYYVYTTYFQAPPTESGAEVGPPKLPVSAIDWDKEIFNNTEYTSLVSPIELPLTSGPIGNPAPFLEGPPKP